MFLEAALIKAGFWKADAARATNCACQNSFTQPRCICWSAGLRRAEVAPATQAGRRPCFGGLFSD